MKLANLEPIEFSKFPDSELFYELYTIDEFFEAAKIGCFNEYDGQGYYSTAHAQSNRQVFVDGKIAKPPQFASHVIWISK